MWIFYVLALIPIAIGAYLFVKNESIVWWEWLIGSAAAFLVAGLMHWYAIHGMTSDIETWSGQITKVSHHPRWVEQYEESHTVTTGSGKNATTTTYYTTEYDTHIEHWTAERNFGTVVDDVDIDQYDYNDIVRKFGGKIYSDGTQSTRHLGHRYSGDNNIYSVDNVYRYVEPVTTTRNFQNRIKATPTVFSFSKVPSNVKVYEWPDNSDWRRSSRLLGTASVLVNLYKWDCMNANLGPTKKVNVIMVGFNDEPIDYGQMQQAKWIGGKKNDLVICFGGAKKGTPAQWVYVFGWTENELVKKNLESILMEVPINDNIIPLIFDEVAKNYVIKDWKKFDYIVIYPAARFYWIYFTILIITQCGLYYWFNINEYGKECKRYSYSNYGLFTRYAKSLASIDLEDFN